MSGMIDYILWRGDLSFEVSPINLVDNLIFARLAYIDFDDLNDDGDSIGKIAERYIASNEKMDLGLLVTGETRAMLQAVGNSERYKSLVVKHFVSIIDDDRELQFSAVTFQLNEEEVYVAFRGTDDNLIGL